jgi:hypothetical protein
MSLRMGASDIFGRTPADFWTSTCSLSHQRRGFAVVKLRGTVQIILGQSFNRPFHIHDSSSYPGPQRI